MSEQNIWLSMQFTEADMDQVDSLIADPEWIFEQKFDGTRALCVVNKKGVWWPGPNGVKALSHTAVTQHFDPLNLALSKLMEYMDIGELVLDGEIMLQTGEYYIWDVVYFTEGGTTIIEPANSDFKTRRRILESLYECLPENGPVKLVRQAKTSEDKRFLWDAVRLGGGEGIMAKRLDGSYEMGERVKHTVKLKFVKTADVVVLEVNRPDKKHGNFVLGVYDEDGEMVHIGTCSAIGKDPDTKVGDVIEVAYLYWTGESMYQPRMLKIRNDKASEQCRNNQFPEYTRIAR